MKLLLSHIADLDGITPVILMNLLNMDFEYELFEVGELDNFFIDKLPSDYFDKYEEIFITDLSVSLDVADKIMASKYKDRIKLFDHHKSAEWLNKYEFAQVYEDINGFMECGTTLFYKYLVACCDDEALLKNSVITFVELVREADTWQFTDLKDESDNLNALFSFYGIDNFIDKYSKFLKNNHSFYFDKTALEVISNLNRLQCEYLKNMEDKIIIKKIDNYNIGVVFAELYRSSLGHHLANLYEDRIDFVCIINLNRSISFRGIKDIDISLFAKKYGGNGHAKACGMPLPSNIKEKIIEEIFK